MLKVVLSRGFLQFARLFVGNLGLCPITSPEDAALMKSHPFYLVGTVRFVDTFQDYPTDTTLRNQMTPER